MGRGLVNHGSTDALCRIEPPSLLPPSTFGSFRWSSAPLVATIAPHRSGVLV